MSGEKFLHFRDLLLETRRDILDRVKNMESRRQEINEPAIEIEEQAQKTTMTQPYDRLDENGKQTIEQIDLALNKVLIGEYGICEHCGDDILLQRLEAVPWTRLCIDCAREFERKHQVLPPPAEAVENTELPDEYQGLSNNQILSIIHDQIEKNGKIDTEELDISIRGGILFLEGTVPGEPEHQVLMELLADVLGFTSIVDHLTVNEVLFERDDRAPGIKGPPAETTLEDRLFYDEEDFTEDLSEAGDEIAYLPPEEPLPHEEERQD
jgi:DnaK suppressor protein